MPERSTWDIVRKRIAPVAFLLALVVLATRTCGSETASVELVFDPGAARDRLVRLHVDVHRPGDDGAPVAYFDSAAGPRMRWTLQLDPGDYRLAFRATLAGGEVRRFDRTIVAEDNAVVTLSLERSLQ